MRGKSCSMINTLVGKPGLARTSNTPGRTQMLNYFRITPEGDGRPFFLVDMSGYGFAAVNEKNAPTGATSSRATRARGRHCGHVQLIDLRHPPQPLDHSMAQWLRDNGHNYLIVGTKADKVAKTKVPELMLQAAEKLNIDSRDTMAFSAQTGLGREQVWRWMTETARGEEIGSRE